MSLHQTIFGLMGLALTPLLASAAMTPEPFSAVKAQVQSNYGKLPLSFEANQGQTAATVNFLSRGPGYTLFLTPTQAVLNLTKPSAARKATREKIATIKPTESAVVRMTLAGANPHPQIFGQAILPGKVNYLIGKDPKRWHTGIVTYGKVTYKQVYPGIDLVYYGNQRQLEHDFVVAPGADPKRIRLAFKGAKHLSVDGHGNLVLTTEGGHVLLQKPIIYQEIAGSRKPVVGSYVLKGNRVGFQVAAWERDRPLVIDPVLAYSTYLGGTDIDYGYAIAVDGTGHAYVTGYVDSTDFPTTPGAFSEAWGGNGFVAKLNATGTGLDYATYLGGNYVNFGNGIAVDSTGHAYVTGYAHAGSHFPTTPGAFQETCGGDDWCGFVAKLNPTGTAFDYATYLGGTYLLGVFTGYAIAVDGTGHAYVTGWGSADLPTTPGAFQETGGGAYLAKLNPTGTALVYATFLRANRGLGIAVDGIGHAYVTGYVDSADFPTTPRAFQESYGGGRDAFVAKLNPTGTALIYATYLGGAGDDSGTGIAVDSIGHAYVTGAASYDFPTTAGAFQDTGSGAYLAKLNPTGTALVYATFLSANRGSGIAVDGIGHAYVTGYVDSADFPTTPRAFQESYGGGRDAFVAKLNPTGTALIYATYLGGAGDDSGTGIAVDSIGHAYVTGAASYDFPTTAGAFQETGSGLDAVVAKLPLGKPTSKDQCKKRGWQNYDFKNQGDCIRYVNTGK